MKYSMPSLEKCLPQVRIGKTVFGDAGLAWIAGPCAVESLKQMRDCAAILTSCGIGVMRGGLYKPRTSPYTFQGLGEKGLDIIRAVKEEFSVAYVAEIVDEESLQVLLPAVDALQIGARNCLNYALLKSAGKAGKPVILKRGFAVTVEEYLNAAEYVASNGCREIILCERGIRTATEVTRFTLDAGAIAWFKANLPLPVLADPSHAAGIAELTPPLALSAVAAGADGVMVEFSSMPDALCDKKQQLSPEQLKNLHEKTNRVFRELHR